MVTATMVHTWYNLKENDFRVKRNILVKTMRSELGDKKQRGLLLGWRQ